MALASRNPALLSNTGICVHTETHTFCFVVVAVVVCLFVLVFFRTCCPVDFWEVMEECSGIVATSQQVTEKLKLRSHFTHLK